MTSGSIHRFQKNLCRVFTSVLPLIGVLLSACGGGGGDPTTVWTNDGLRTQGSISVVPSNVRVREGESVPVSANFSGPGAFDGTRVEWSVQPASVGRVEDGRFVAEGAGEAQIVARFSSVSATAAATVIPEPTDVLPLSPTSLVGWAGGALADSVEVRLVGRSGAPAPDVDVYFAVESGGGVVSHGQRRTGEDGVARTLWSLGPQSGTNRLRVWADGLAPVTVSAEGLPDRESAELHVVSGLDQQGTVGEPLQAPFVVQVTDRSGNPLSGVALDWKFSAGAASTTGVFGLPSDEPTTLRDYTDADGRSMVYWQLGTVAGDQFAEVFFADGAASAAAAAEAAARGGRVLLSAKAKPGKVDQIVLVPGEIGLEVAEVSEISALTVDRFGNTAEVSDLKWSSSDLEVAHVDDGGNVTGVGDGSATITAKAGNVEGSAAVVVTAPPPVVTSVTASEQTLDFDAIGDSAQLSATAFDTTGTSVPEASLVWSSTNPLVASVDGTGLVRSRAVGTAGIVVAVTCCNVADTVMVEVFDFVDPIVTSVVASHESIDFEGIGETLQLVASARDSAGSDMPGSTFVWSSLDPNVASVDSLGLVEALGVGSTQVLVSANCCEASDTVEVVVQEPPPPPVGVSLDVDEIVLPGAGLSMQLRVQVIDLDGGVVEDPSVSWQALNPGVVSVNDNGLVTGVAEGVGKVVATDCCAHTDTATVYVGPQVTGVAASTESVELTSEDTTTQLFAAFIDFFGRSVSAAPQWQSLNEDVATVSPAGVVTAVGSGETTVVVSPSCCDVADSVHVSVDMGPEVLSVEIDRNSVVFDAIGSELALSAVVRDGSGAVVDTAEVVWTSTNSSVVSVDSMGKLRSRANGLVLITASAVCCGGSDTMSAEVRQQVHQVSVTPPFHGMGVGDVVTLTAIARDSKGSLIEDVDFDWNVTDPSVASVNSTGRVVGVGEGNVEVTASASSRTGTSNISVAPEVLPAPTPEAGDFLAFDTRAGGSHDLQTATTIDGAKAALGAGTKTNTPGTPYVVDFTTNVDGQGTRAFRFNWKEWGPKGRANGCLNPPNMNHQHDLHVAKSLTLSPGDNYLSYKIWMGRSATGGGVGEVGSFKNRNTSCGPGGHKMIVWFRRDGSGATTNDQRFTLSADSNLKALFRQKPRMDDPFDLDQLVGQVVTVTVRIRTESTAGAGDGLFQLWINDSLIQDRHGAPTGDLSLGLLQIGGPTWISPPQDQTMYLWDIVAWQKN